MSEDNQEWYNGLFEQEIEEHRKANLKAYSLREASAKQEDAIRAYAQEQGFKNLRELRHWMSEAELDYYDIIKVASPE